MPVREEHGSLSEIFTRDFLLLAIINLTMFFGFQMTNVGLPVYVAQLGAGAQVVGLVGTVMTITAVAVRIFAGPLLDRFGRKGALLGGSVVMAASIFSYAVFPIVGIILGMRLLQGLGWGLGSTASSTMAADVIPKRRFAEGMGYFALTNALSSALAPAVSIALVQGPGAHYMIYAASGCAALAFVLALFQRNTVQGKRSVEDTRTEQGRADGSRAAGGPPNSPDLQAGTPLASGESGPLIHSSDLGSSLDAAAGDPLGASFRASTGAPSAVPSPTSADAPSAVPSPASAGAPSGAPSPAPSAPAAPRALDAVFERRAVFPGMLMLLVNIGFGCITSFIALHGQEQGVGNVSVYFIAYAAVTLASRPMIGRLIDRYGYRMPSILSCLGTVLTLVLIGVSSNEFMFACSGALAGLGIGTAMGVYQAMAVASVEPWRRGVATSTYFIAFDVGIAVGSLLGGVIAGALGYAVMYVVVAAFPLVACVLSAAAIKKPVR